MQQSEGRCLTLRAGKRLLHGASLIAGTPTSQGYDFFSSKYEKMMAGRGTQHFMTWLIDSPKYTSDALFVMILVTCARVAPERSACAHKLTLKAAYED